VTDGAILQEVAGCDVIPQLAFYHRVKSKSITHFSSCKNFNITSKTQRARSKNDPKVEPKPEVSSICCQCQKTAASPSSQDK